MEITNTMTSGAVEMTSADARVWRDRLQPGAHLLADIVIPVQGTTLPTVGIDKVGALGQAAVQVIAPAFAVPTYNSMDVPPFRSGRPPV
ncbi:MAG TPA: hypothetical protein VIG79_17770 [Lapillicoccus sp.]|jgi:hypothetical protein|uniref:hypothetical protein n=1 Tax=Lapillicoccus sp. TaxID=1909287 RepID=UPI002F93BA9C